MHITTEKMDLFRSVCDQASDIAERFGLMPETNHIFIRFATTLRPAFTSRKKLARILRNLLDDIQKAEARAASTDIASSRDILASMVENRRNP